MTKTIAGQLNIFGAIVILGILALVSTQLFASKQLRVSGPTYQQIITGKDLLADVAPSQMNVTQAYMLANEMFAHPTLRDVNTAKIQDLRNVFDRQVSQWQRRDIPNNMRSALEENVLPVSVAFWKVLDDEFIPSLRTNDNVNVEIALGALLNAFQSQQIAIGEFVKLASSSLAATEQSAASEAFFLDMIIYAVITLSILIVLLGIMMFRKRAINPLSEITAFMALLTKEDYSKELSLAERNDEIGDIAKSVTQLKEAAFERQRLRENAEQERQAKTDEDVANHERETQAANERAHFIAQLSDGLTQLSRGDLTHRIDEEFAPEFEKLRSAFNSSIETLASTLTDVSEATRQVRQSADTVNASSDDLSRRTEQQAASLEQTAAALDQVTATVRQSTDKANKASEMVTETKSGAEKSGVVVRNAIEAMTKIEESATQISQIISVIDEIAFQTNLLALNAGVEAARAGEAGKGFAVVAQEVRELAGRTTNAAKEIKALIDTSSSQVETGVSLVNDTSTALVEIESNVASINEVIHSIVTGATEQSTALAEINTAVNQMDQVTQQNANMVQETNRSCEGLIDLSSQLDGLIQRFRLTSGRPYENRNRENKYSARENTQYRREQQAPHGHQERASSTRQEQALRPVDEQYRPSRTSSNSPARSLGRRLAAGLAADANSERKNWDEF
ncbi:MAG: methyl-accepting chemotaxis protein [Lentilitoribacter sp.]